MIYRYLEHFPAILELSWELKARWHWRDNPLLIDDPPEKKYRHQIWLIPCYQKGTLKAFPLDYHCIERKIWNTGKYLLRGYIIGVLTHTTAWDWLWGDGVSLRLYKGSSTSLHSAAVVFWKSDHVFLKSSIRSSASPRSVAVWLGFWNSDNVVLK